MTRTLMSRWIRCGRWSGVVAERRVPPEEPPEWPACEDWEPGDNREIALTIGGVDWLAAIHGRVKDLRGRVILRWTLATGVPGEVVARMSLIDMDPPTGLLTGRYGKPDAPGSLIETLSRLVASDAVLAVDGRREVTIEDQVLVTLAHPWHGYRPGTTLTVPPRTRDQLDVAGYAARRYDEQDATIWVTP